MIHFTTCGKSAYMRKPDKLPAEMRFFRSYSGNTINVEPQQMSVSDFAEYITSGHAFYPCVLNDKGIYKTVNRKCFEYADIIAFDLEKGDHSEEKVRDCLINRGLKPCFFYRTYSHQQDGKGDRNRIVYHLPYTVKNSGEYLFLGVLFWSIYKDIDTTCIDTARLFYGTTIKQCYVNEDAVLNVDTFLQRAIEAIKDAKENDTEFYKRLIGKLTENSINASIGPDGLPVCCCKDGRIVYEENLAAKQERIRRESNNAAIDDRTIESSKEINRITIFNWYEKAMIEPLFRELTNGTGDFGYKKAVVMASNYRFIDDEEVKETFFRLLRDNAYRFSDINHTIEECAKIWSLPDSKSAGFGARPLPYRFCGEYPQDGYEYPLTFLRNQKRTLDLQRNKRASEDLAEIFEKYDFEARPHDFLINGGTGLGKTYSFLNDGSEKTFSMKRALDKRYGKPLKMAFLCSRQAAQQQNLKDKEYKNTTVGQLYYVRENEDSFDLDASRIYCLTYHKFMALINNNTINENTFDVIVCDECHSLFDDNFAEQMGAFINWALHYKGIIIWITANAGYFVKCYNRFIATLQHDKNTIKPLYDDETQHLVMRYDTANIIYSTNSTVEWFIWPEQQKLSPNYRVLVYLKRAIDCYNFYRQAVARGMRAAFYVSAYCDTPLSKELLSKDAKDKDKIIDEDVLAYMEEHGLAAVEMNKVFDLLEDERTKAKSQRIKDALLGDAMFPDDVDIIFTTDALRESINIHGESNVKVIITDDYSEVGVLQKRGRIRGDIEKYYIIPNRQGTKTGLIKQIQAFEGKNTPENPGVLHMTQQQLAEEYGKQIQRRKLNKSGTAYVIRKGDPASDEAIYTPNVAAYIGLTERLEEFQQIDPPDKEHNRIAAEKYSVLTSSGFVNVVYSEAARRVYVDREVVAIAEKYAGLPLIGHIKDELLEECKPFLRTANGGQKFDLRLVLSEVKAQGFEVKRGKIGKKHIKEYGLPENLLRQDYISILSRK